MIYALAATFKILLFIIYWENYKIDLILAQGKSARKPRQYHIIMANCPDNQWLIRLRYATPDQRPESTGYRSLRTFAFKIKMCLQPCNLI